MGCLRWSTGFVLLAAIVYGVPLSASPISGTAIFGDHSITWEARRNIVTTLSPDPTSPNFADYVFFHGTPRVGYSGIAGLQVSSPGGNSICTGSLLADGVSILTAAHCLADEFGSISATSVSATFFPDDGGSYTTNSSTFFVHPLYTGSVLDDHDIAIIRLDSAAPHTVQRYRLFEGDAVGSAFEVVGFGRRGQGETGDTIPSGTRVRGFNVFDAQGSALLPFLEILSANNVLMFDFDNGDPANDGFGFWLGIQQLGLGALESLTAGGDSGGPSFVDGRIAAVTSFGLTFGAIQPDDSLITTDFLPGLNASFGEFAGSTSVAYNARWVSSLIVPEPAPWLLFGLGALLIVAGSRLRRLRNATETAEPQQEESAARE